MYQLINFYRRIAITRREFYGGKVVGESAIKKDTEAGHVIKHRFFVSKFIRFISGSTVETHIKEPVFIRTLRLKFNLLSPLNKNPPDGRGSYLIGFICSEFRTIFKNSFILIRILQKTACKIFN